MIASKQQRNPRYRRVSTISLRLQERDKEIIKQVYRHRFLNSEHIYALIGGSQQQILRRLNVLFHTGYLTRPPEQIRPYLKGSNPMVYGLGNKGADLLAEEFHIPRAKVDWTSKARDVKGLYLDHTLMISNFMVCLELACQSVKGVELIPPGRIIADMRVKSRSQAYPLSWVVTIKREYGGTKKDFRLNLIPDKAFGLYFPQEQPGRQHSYFFLEADRSTMPIKRSNFYRPSIVRKFLGYHGSWQIGLYPEIFGFKAARIAIITKSQERINNMIQAAKELDQRGKGLRMFLFALASSFDVEQPESILHNVWQSSRDGESVSIIN